MQELALGGLRPEPRRHLLRIAQQFKETGAANTPPRPELKPGTRLVREWQGRTYDVLVLDEGFSWQNTRYRSLSAIARKITGTAWSGPLFFGLQTHRYATHRSSHAQGQAAPPPPPQGHVPSDQAKEENKSAGRRQAAAPRDLHPENLRGRARAGIQFARGAAGSLRSLQPQPAQRGLGICQNPL